MAENYDKINSKLKNIVTLNSVTLSDLVGQIPITSNCLISGGFELESHNGARVFNRRIIVSRLIKRLINEYPSGMVVFYKSSFIKNDIHYWLNSYHGRKKVRFLDYDNYGLEPFKGMSNEEIIYTIKSISNYIEIPLDQYSETFLDYILKVLKALKYESSFDNIMTLVNLTNEELSIIAKKAKLEVEAKYFSRSDNGCETIKRVFKQFNNFVEKSYRNQNTMKTNIINEIKQGNVIFVYLDDQYQSELLEYFSNELKCISKYNPYLLFDDIMIKRNKELEDLLIKTVGIRFCFSSLDIGGMITNDKFDDFRVLMPTKLLLHYDDVNAAEKLSSTVGYYYHLKVSQDYSKNKEAFQLSPFDARISEGTSVSEEKREIIEGTDLINLKGNQLYFIDRSIEKYLVNRLLFDK